jgi:hypothetical protein
MTDNGNPGPNHNATKHSYPAPHQSKQESVQCCEDFLPCVADMSLASQWNTSFFCHRLRKPSLADHPDSRIGLGLCAQSLDRHVSVMDKRPFLTFLSERLHLFL